MNLSLSLSISILSLFSYSTQVYKGQRDICFGSHWAYLSETLSLSGNDYELVNCFVDPVACVEASITYRGKWKTSNDTIKLVKMMEVQSRHQIDTSLSKAYGVSLNYSASILSEGLEMLSSHKQSIGNYIWNGDSLRNLFKGSGYSMTLKAVHK